MIFAAGLQLLLLLASGVAFAEVMCRWWLRAHARYRPWKPHYRAEFHLDSAILPGFPSPARFYVNSRGERGSDPPRVPGKLYKVLVAGGSAAEGYILDQDVTWPMQLQRMLGRRTNLNKLGASGVHVANIAKSGVGAHALDMILQKALPQSDRVDAIIIMVGATDVIKWLQDGAPAHPRFRPVDASQYFAQYPDRSFRWQPRETAAAEVVRRYYDRLFRPVDLRTGVGKSIVHLRQLRAGAMEVRRHVPDPCEMVAHFELHFRRIIRRAIAGAPRVIIALQPWLDDSRVRRQDHWRLLWHGAVGYPADREPRIFYSTEVLCRLMTEIEECSARVAGELGVECCELRSAIEPSFTSYYDLFHFTPAGASTVAGVLADALLQNGNRRPSRPQLLYYAATSLRKNDVRLALQ